MFDAILNFARNTPFWHFSWGDTELHIVNMLSEETAPSLNRATILLSPYLDSRQWDKQMVTRWAAVASTALYSEKVVSSVVNTLLQLGTSDTLRPDVPIGMWAWLKKQPSLPPSCHGRYDATQESRLIRYLRGLGDLDILKSYFVVVWSEWDHLEDSHFYQAQTSIVEDFVGISMQPHRTDLIKRLDHVIKRLNRGLDHFQRFEWWIKEGEIQGRKRQYETLRKVLLKVDKRATRILTGMFHTLAGFNRSTDFCEYVQNRIQRSPVLCPSRIHDFVAWSRWHFFNETLGFSSQAVLFLWPSTQSTTFPSFLPTLLTIPCCLVRVVIPTFLLVKSTPVNMPSGHFYVPLFSLFVPHSNSQASHGL